MPGLQACGRRWNIASDDFILPGIIEAIIRLGAFTAYAVIFFTNWEKIISKCMSYQLHIAFYGGGTALIYVGSFVLATSLALISCRGAIMDTSKRWLTIPLLYFHFALLLAEITFNIVTAVFIFEYRSAIEASCSDVYTLFVLVFSCSWVMMFIVLIEFIFVFDPAGKEANSWSRRCKCLFFTKRKQSNDLQTAADLLSELFEDVDLVTSDVLAAVTLLYRENVGHRDTIVRQLEAPSDVKDWMTPDNALHYAKFGVASYGWPMYVFVKGPLSCLSICGCCPCCCSSPVDAVSDPCHTNRRTACKMAEIKPADLIHIDMSNDYGDLPYIVAFDHRKRAIVIGVRGTWSIADTLVDFQAYPKKVLGTDILPAGSTAHQGAYDSAVRIRDRLETTKALEEAFQQQPDYVLVLCGHSLGAGCAALLSVLLRPQYPTLRCFAISPIGGLMSASLSEYCRDFICTVVLNNDVVPFITVHNVHALKNSMKRVLNDTPFSKCQIFWNSKLPSCCASKPEGRRSQTGILEEDVLEKLSLLNHPLLYPPGIICRFLTKKERRLVVWQHAAEMGRIMITKGFLTDHRPQRYMHVLNTTPPLDILASEEPGDNQISSVKIVIDSVD